MNRLAAAVALSLWLPVMAAAQVSETTIERIAALTVEQARLGFLWNSGQLDTAGYHQRLQPVEAELKTLWQPIRQLSSEEQARAASRIEGLTSSRLAVLRPQWEREAGQARREHEARKRDLGDAIRTDALAALEPQRRRLRLQQQLDRGEISRETFAAEDKKAADRIQTIRSKYVSDAGGADRKFDHELMLLTEALAGNPDTPLPASRVPAGQGGGTSPADYAKDVALAARLTAEKQASALRFSQGKESGPTMRETEKTTNQDIRRLIEKWRAVSPAKGAQFERDYRQRYAARTPSGGTAPVRGPGPPPPPPPPPGPPVAFYVILAALGLGAPAFLLWLAFRRKPAVLPPPLTEHYGTASYAPQEFVTDDYSIRTGVFLGKSSAPGLLGASIKGPGAPVFTRPEHHTLIVAPTRTGKGTRVIVPTLLRYAGSAIVIDPKGENAAITAVTREEQLRSSVHIINPWDMLAQHFRELRLKPATYNPLDVLERSDPNAVAIARSLAAAVCPTAADDKDYFWQSHAANMLTAVFLWLADQPGEQKTLARARNIVSRNPKQLATLFLAPMSVSTAFGGAIKELAGPFVGMADETYTGITANLTNNTAFLSDPRIKAATATSSFSMRELINGLATVYLIIPPDQIATQKTWLRLVLAAAMHAFKRFPMDEDKDFAHNRCLFLIDEFGALGRLEDLPRDIATMAGYGVDFVLIVQGLDQIKAHYGAAADTILGNCAYKWFCNVGDFSTAEHLSKTLGKATVGTVGTSVSASAGGAGAAREGESTTFGEMGRDLLTPDEVLNLGRDVAIALQPGGNPLYLRPVDYWYLLDAFAHLRELNPGLYWQPPLAATDNPYAPPAEKGGFHPPDKPSVPPPIFDDPDL